MEKAKQEIRERLDPAILAFLEKRAAQRKAQQGDTPSSSNIPMVSSGPLQECTSSACLAGASSITGCMTELA